MNAFAGRTVNAYAYTRIGVETGVVSASPQQLILMLYQGAIAAIAAAQQHLRVNNIAAKGEAISKAISIIDDGLKVSLDLSVGGQMAQNLFDLYVYMSQRLLVANLKNDSASLDEVAELLQQLGGAWETIAAKQAGAKPAATAPAVPRGAAPPVQAPGPNAVGAAAPAQTAPGVAGSHGQARAGAAAGPAPASAAAAVHPSSQQRRLAAAYGVR